VTKQKQRLEASKRAPISDHRSPIGLMAPDAYAHRVLATQAIWGRPTAGDHEIGPAAMVDHAYAGK
jgi:hypothetical protein